MFNQEETLGQTQDTLQRYLSIVAYIALELTLIRFDIKLDTLQIEIEFKEIIHTKTNFCSIV